MASLILTTIYSPFGIFLFIVIGTIFSLNSAFAIFIESMSSTFAKIGAPRETCNDLAPIKRATSNLVNLFFGQINFPPNFPV